LNTRTRKRSSIAPPKNKEEEALRSEGGLKHPYPRHFCKKGPRARKEVTSEPPPAGGRETTEKEGTGRRKKREKKLVISMGVRDDAYLLFSRTKRGLGNGEKGKNQL